MLIATGRLALDVDLWEEGTDAVNEILREQQRHFAPQSCLVDYAIVGISSSSVQPAGYEEGDFLVGKQPALPPTDGPCLAGQTHTPNQYGQSGECRAWLETPATAAERSGQAPTEEGRS